MVSAYPGGNMTRQEMAEIIQAVVDAEAKAKAGGRGDCYEFPEDQVEALVDAAKWALEVLGAGCEKWEEGVCGGRLVDGLCATHQPDPEAMPKPFETPPEVSEKITRMAVRRLEGLGFRVFRPADCEQITQGGWRCLTCGEDCRADGPGCEGSEYPSQSFWLVPVKEDN